MEEIRCIQDKLLDIAKEYIRVCELLNLRYFASDGTCLGAIRHNGFIPWDDDMDFSMPREDYEIFMQKGHKYLTDNYFIQNHLTDKCYYLPYGKIRDSSTTAIQKETKNLNINHGLWIDIFPVDKTPKTKLGYSCTLILKKWFLQRRTLQFIYTWDSWRNRLWNLFIKIIVPSKEIAYKMDKWLSIRNNKNNSSFAWNNYFHYINCHFDSDSIKSFIKMEFEGVLVNVPAKYDSYLKSIYGNWKELPPLDERVPAHNFCVLDLTQSYINYID